MPSVQVPAIEPRPPDRRRLPFVPRCLPGEWLGHWLLRVAATYGVSFEDLLALGGIVRRRSAVELTWARMTAYPGPEWRGLAGLLGERMAAIRQRQRLIAEPAPRAAQWGYCPACLQQDLDHVLTPYWRRSWMDPYIGACARHRCWLNPIEGHELRVLATARATARRLTAMAGHRPTSPAPPGVLRLQKLLLDESRVPGQRWQATSCRNSVDRFVRRLAAYRSMARVRFSGFDVFEELKFLKDRQFLLAAAASFFEQCQGGQPVGQAGRDRSKTDPFARSSSEEIGQ